MTEKLILEKIDNIAKITINNPSANTWDLESLAGLEEIILLSRWKAANLYEKEFTKIIQKLSMHECSKELKKNRAQVSFLNSVNPIINPMKKPSAMLKIDSL